MRVAITLPFAGSVLGLALAMTGCAGDDGTSVPTPTRTSALQTATAVATATAVPPQPSATASPTPDEPQCPAPQLPPGVEVGDAEILFTDGCRAFVRTPDERFEGLVDYPFAPHYATVDGMRMHYVDEGPADGEVVLMLHGQPAWSYLYRKMIPIIADAGFRVVAADHIGMGRSDKPIELDDYRYLQHVAWVEEFIDVLGLENVTLFCHDWGSLIGLRVVGDEPERFARVVVANGRLPVVPASLDLRLFFTVPDPPTLNPDAPLTVGRCAGTQNECFSEWIAYSLTNPNFRPSQILPLATATDLAADELAAYDAPFPDLIYMSGVRTFPSLIVTLNEQPTNEAARMVFDEFEKPLLTLFGRLDPALGSEEVQAELRDTVPGAQGQPHHAYPDAHHFVQEDKGEDLADRVVDFMRSNPLEDDPIEDRVDGIFPGDARFGRLNREEARRVLTAEEGTFNDVAR